MAESQSLSILKSLQAENMLQGWGILKVLKEIRPSMVYKDMPFSKCFDVIQDDIAKIGWMKLRPNVDITTASEYLVELATNYERTLEGLNRSTMDTQNLLGYCKTIRAKLTTMTQPFHILWSIGASEMTADCSGLKKIKDADWKALANMELSALVEEADQELDAMIEALKITLANLKTMRQTAASTYQVGRDQVNAALSDLEQSDKGFGNGSGQVPQRAGIMALTGLFPGRVQQGQLTVDEPMEEDVLPEDAPVAETPAPVVTPPPVVLPPPAPEATKPAATRKKDRDLPSKVTVVEQPVATAPKVEEPKQEAPKVEEQPQPVTPVDPPKEPVDIQKAVANDPFISTAQKTEILKQVEPPKAEEDDFPADAPTQAPAAQQDEDDFPDLGAQPAAQTTSTPEESDDDFPAGDAQVVNVTPASKELAAGAKESTPKVEEKKEAEAETKPVETETKAPKAETKPVETKGEDKPRAAGGLFGKRSAAVPPNMTAAPAFQAKAGAADPDKLTEFM